MQVMDIQIVDISTAVAVSQQIPEFADAYPASEYEKRLLGVPHLILVAYLDGQAAGFKVGYERDGRFYSWMGGVLPAFRKMGVAKALADYQEDWARSKAYREVAFKTRNYLKPMLIFALGNGFEIESVEAKAQRKDNRIWLVKDI